MTSSCSADDADDWFAASGRDVEHLHQPFLLELPESFVELFVARVLEPDAPEMLRRKTRHTEKPQRLAGGPCRRSQTAPD